jgi:two-component system OmpR family response regulator
VRILLVDDDPDIRQIAALSLRRIGKFEVVAAASGADALNALAVITAAGREVPDLVLLDVSMPGMDGPATLQALRSDPATAKVPVAFFTATSSDEEVARLCALGAVAVIPKPFDVAALSRQVRDILREIGLD